MAPRKSPWPNRITRHEEVDPAHLVANPGNWRIHPASQAEALRAVLDRVGWVGPVIVNERSGHVIDGHLRVQEAVSKGIKRIPVAYVDLDDVEERAILLTFDRIGALAVTDQAKLDEEIAALLGDAPDLEALLAVGGPEPVFAGGDDGEGEAGEVVACPTCGQPMRSPGE